MLIQSLHHNKTKSRGILSNVKGKKKTGKAKITVEKEQEKTHPPGHAVRTGTNLFIHGHTPFYPARPLNLPIISTLFVSILATVFSIYPYISIIGIYKKYEGLVSIVAYIIFFYAVVNFVERRRLNLLLNVIIITACIAAIYGVFQHFGLDYGRWTSDFEARAFSTFGNPVFFSAFLIMVIPLVHIKIFSDSDFKIPSYFYLAALALITFAFYFTKTRACFLGLIVSNLVFFSLIGRKALLANKIKTIAAIAVLIGISIFCILSDRSSVVGRFVQDLRPDISESKPDTIKNVQKDGPQKEQVSTFPSGLEGKYVGFVNKLEGTMFVRAFTYLSALKIIYDYPVLGIGPETLALIHPQYVAKIFSRADKQRYYDYQDRIHNDFLDITVSRGLLGLGIYLWLIFAYSRGGMERL